MKNTNEMEIIFDSRSSNEGFARVAVASFMTQLNPTVEEVADVKTAVSEAVTNAIIHGYENEIHKISVSYTHLDVYKRQLFYCISGQKASVCPDTFKCILAVSGDLQWIFAFKKSDAV